MIKRLKKGFYTITGSVATGGALLLSSSPAHAALDLTGISVDIAPVEAIAVLLITAMAAIWGIRKAISMWGR